ncbi:glutathione-disulfide reductase [Ahrensia sp. R2A130]|uniref:glutathione-disulfide reductase n=1 Tax=Ahrensia sp. R2A130 TaxID=744979 RepID=UPI0001E0F06B|nr:glutathione-disulfide reductase [Ahrensia sp. R2A130]EFL90421.1 glutathione-disulfide reductase [Ahrensia sp. R2A130]
MAYDYDLFVIGGGSGGVRAANRTAALGKKVGLAEESRYGGTCVVRGCVPKKLYVYASGYHEHFEDAEGYGFKVGDVSFDWNTLVSRKEAEITRLEGLYRRGLSGNEVELFDTRAELRGPHSVWLKSEDREVTAERILIAVGGTPNRHESVEGHELAITSDEAFDLPDLPKTILIAGAGYIAVEFAGIFNGLGVDTQILYRGQEILSGFDDDVRALLHSEYEKRGIRIRTHDVFAKIEELEGGRRRCHLKSGDVVDVDCVMLALGRSPLTASLGLEYAGIATDAKGYIEVDDYSRTSCESVWAVGDVTGRVQLTPVAIHESMCFVSTEYRDTPQRPDHEMIATAVFSHPEIGTVGMTELEACEAYDELNVFKANFRAMKYVLPDRDTRMLMKLIVDAKTDKLVGAHIVGPDAGEMAQLLAIPMKMGCTKADVDATMALHPSAAEELVTMYEPSYTVKAGIRSDGTPVAPVNIMEPAGNA